MLRRLLALLIAAVAIGAAGHVATAQTPAPADTVLVDGPGQGLRFFLPGGSEGDCFDLGSGTLKITTSSPPGRTGETASLRVFNASDPSPELGLLADLKITPNAMYAEYKIGSGRYCYQVTVTHQFTNPLDATDPNRPERPMKQVALVLAFRPDQ